MGEAGDSWGENDDWFSAKTREAAARFNGEVIDAGAVIHEK